MANALSFSYRERHTKKRGVVYDVVFRIIDETGHERQKLLCGFQTKKLAKDAFLEYMSHYIAPPRAYDKKSTLSYEFARDNYFGYIKSTLKESSVYSIIHTFAKNIDPYFKGKDMAALTAEDFIVWQDTVWSQTKPNGTPYSPSRLAKIRTFFSTFLRWCEKRYKITNFLADIETPKRRVQKREYTIWTPADFDAFIAVVDNLKYKTLFTVLFYCGCRIGELQALTCDCYDGRSIKIAATYTRKTIDGSSYKITDTKNYKTHVVPLPSQAQAALNEWLQYKRDNNINNTFIFGAEHPISQHAIQVAADKYMALAQVPRIRLHDFRHSYVSMLLSKGVNFAVIAALIGDTVEQVVKTYAHLTPSDIDKAIALIDDQK